MRLGFKVVVLGLFGWSVLTAFDKASAGGPAKKPESGRGLDLKDLPLPVIEVGSPGTELEFAL